MAKLQPENVVSTGSFRPCRLDRRYKPSPRRNVKTATVKRVLNGIVSSIRMEMSTRFGVRQLGRQDQDTPGDQSGVAGLRVSR